LYVFVFASFFEKKNRLEILLFKMENILNF
jgi:hypothetical protein